MKNDPIDHGKPTAQIISLAEHRAKRTLAAFRARVGQLRESVADMRKVVDRDAPLLLSRREPPG